MFTALKNRIGRLKSNLNRVGEDQPLHKFSMVILIFLDIFILVSIFDGLDSHTRQLTSPDESIPHTCREMVIQHQWNGTSRLDKLTEIIQSYGTSYYRIEMKEKRLHPICAPLLGPIEKIKKDKDLAPSFETRRKFQTESRDLEQEISELKGPYDSSLLESIARQDRDKPAVDSIRMKVREKTAAMNALRGRLTALDERLNQAGPVKILWEKIEALAESDRDRLKSDLRSLNFWFPVKEFGMQLLFLLPLFAVFYIWNSTSIRRNRGVQTLVSSHLLVISFIPILFKTMELVYDIIPKKLLKKIMDFMISLNLIAVWYYLIIALSVAAALILIFIFHRKLFSREKLAEKRIAKGLCQRCGKPMPPSSRACPFCGFSQFKACGQCQKPTHVHSKFCSECGSPQPPMPATP